MGSSSGSDLFVYGNTIAIGNNECLTVIGHITLTATTSVTVGDVIGRSSVAITAPSISIYKHEPGQIYDASGVLYTSTQTNLLSLNVPVLTGAVSTFGPGIDPAIEAVNVSPDVFTASLVYIGNLLNFDLSAPPPPPPSPSPSNQGIAKKIEFQSELAITEMETMRLPIFWNPICTKRDYMRKQFYRLFSNP